MFDDLTGFLGAAWASLVSFGKLAGPIAALTYLSVRMLKRWSRVRAWAHWRKILPLMPDVFGISWAFAVGGVEVAPVNIEWNIPLWAWTIAAGMASAEIARIFQKLGVLQLRGKK